MALAKGEKAAVEDKPETIAEKMAEPKGDLKDKIGLAFTTGGTGSMRMWITNTLGLDLSANIGVGGGSDFGLGLGANIVFPILEQGVAAIYITPGMLVSFNTARAGGVSTSNIGFNFNVGLEAEAFIVKNLVSVGGEIGLNIGINVNSTAGVTDTSFIMNLGTSPAALFVRVYM
jgi:hypothetical protein